MVWKKILNFPSTGFGTFLLASVFVLFFSFFLNTRNTFAVDDFVVDLNQSNFVSFSNFYFCGSDSGRNCIDYDYLIVDPIDVSSLTTSSRFQFRFSPSNQFVSFSPFVMSRLVLSLSDNLSSFYLTNFQDIDYPFSIRITLTDTLPSDCPACEECQQCPAIPENPYDDKFDKIIVAIYTCGAIILVIYFFYCIYGMIIKSTGGK